MAKGNSERCRYSPVIPCSCARLISEIRNFRQSKGLSPKEALDLKIRANGNVPALQQFSEAIIKLGNLTGIEHISEKPQGAFPFVVRELECFIPMTENVDKDAERKRLAEELEYTKGFLKSVAAKLGNERFTIQCQAGDCCR